MPAGVRNAHDVGVGQAHVCFTILFVMRCTGSADNTRAALHFATAAARVVMRPQLNRVASSKAVIKAMASEIQQLKAKLVSSQDFDCRSDVGCNPATQLGTGAGGSRPGRTLSPALHVCFGAAGAS